MIHDYETIVREFILNSQIPIIVIHENHHLYHHDLEPQLDAIKAIQKKKGFQLAKCLLNSTFRSDREASTALASLKKNGGVVTGWDGWKYTKKYMDVSENRCTPKSSILIGFSIINHPFWGTPIFWKHPHVLQKT